MTSCVVSGNVPNGGRLGELIARNPVTGDQVTHYEHGVTLGENDFAANSLLRAEVP